MELVTCDHIVSRTMAGLTGAKDALVLKDLYSNLKQFCPVKTKNLDDMITALQYFQGQKTIKLMYYDNSGEIINACRQLGILRE
eukprot:4919689-Heterocapsa_arctica.AAC.1